MALTDKGAEFMLEWLKLKRALEIPLDQSEERILAYLSSPTCGQSVKVRIIGRG